MPLPIPQQVPPTGTAGHFATGPSTGTTNHSSIAIIDQSEWDQVPVKHRATHFAAQISSINTHWGTMLDVLDQACKDTELNIARLKADTALQRDNVTSAQARAFFSPQKERASKSNLEPKDVSQSVVRIIVLLLVSSARGTSGC